MGLELTATVTQPTLSPVDNPFNRADHRPDDDESSAIDVDKTLKIASKLVAYLPHFAPFLPRCSQDALISASFMAKSWIKMKANPAIEIQALQIVEHGKELPQADALLKIAELIEHVLGLSIRIQAKEIIENEELVVQLLDHWHFSSKELVQVFVAYGLAKKIDKSSSTELLKSRMGLCTNKADALAFITSFIERAEKGSLMASSRPKPREQLKPTQNQPKDRVYIEYPNEKQEVALVTIDCTSNERIEVVSPSGSSILITESGRYSLKIETNSIVRLVKNEEITLLLLKPSEVTVLVDAYDKTPMAKMIRKLFGHVLEEHRVSFLPAQLEIMHAVLQSITELQQPNTILISLQSLEQLLRGFEKKGLPKKITVEILDVLAGHSTGGLLLKPHILDLITQQNKLSSDQWTQLFKVAGNKRELERLLQSLQKSNVLQESVVATITESITQATPGHNIAQLADVFVHSLNTASTNAETLDQNTTALLELCYVQKALDSEQQLSYREFKNKALRAVFPKFEQIDIATKAALIDSFKDQELTLQWLYAEITGSFQELQHAQIRQALKLDLRETTGIVGRDFTKLRYDYEQNALIVAVSLSEVMPTALHQYMQMRTQQGSFFREYVIPLSSRPELSTLSSALREKPSTNGFVAAEQVQRALLESTLSNYGALEKKEEIELLLTKKARAYIADKYLTNTPDEKEERVSAMVANITDILKGNKSLGEQKKLIANLAKTITAQESKNICNTLLESIYTQCTMVITALHGWGGNSETSLPLSDAVGTACDEANKKVLIVAENYMGASGSNQVVIPGQSKPATFANGTQTLTETYGTQLAPLLHKLNGASSTNLEHRVLGHSMGGHVVLTTAVAIGDQFVNTRFIALEPVISTKNKKVVRDGKEILHYISLLGSEAAGDERGPIDKLAADLNQLVATGKDNSALPELIKNGLVSAGDLLRINEIAYYRLVKNSDPRAAHAHGSELTHHRDSFHTHVTRMLQNVRAFTPAEKRALIALGNQVTIVLATEDDVLKWEIGFGDFYSDPALSAQEKELLEQNLTFIIGNHYGHLQPNNQQQAANLITHARNV